MASNTYQINGIAYKRSIRQGRTPKPRESVKVPVTIFVLPSEREYLKRRADDPGMSLSSYGELALSLFDISQFSTAENCSKQ